MRSALAHEPANSKAPISPPANPGLSTAGTPGDTGAPGPRASVPTVPLSATRVYDFHGDRIEVALRTLAHEAKTRLLVTEKAAAAGGTVNMRIVGKTPREAIEIIVEAKGLAIDQDKNGAIYIKSSEEK